MCRERFETSGKVLADTAHQQEDKCVAVTSAQLVADTLECVCLQALVGVAELCTEQADVPRNLHPQHEERNGCERTVDGVVGTQFNLVVNVCPLHRHEDDSCQDAWQDGVPPFDARVGHHLEKQHEDEHGKEDGRDVQEERHCLAEQLRVGKQSAERLQEEAQTAGDDYDEGQEQEDADVVDNLAVDGARALHEPNGVESLFDIRSQREQRVEQEDKADTDKDAALRVLQVRVHEVENRVGNVGIALERISQFGLDDGVETKASGNGEDNGHYGDSGQHTAVGEGGSVVHDVVLRDTLPGDDEPLQYRQSQLFEKAEPLLIYAPYMF